MLAVCLLRRRRPRPRRKFHKIHIAYASPTTSQAIERITALYAIEAGIRSSTPEIRKTIRQASTKALLDGIHIWLEATLAKILSKCDTAAAICYALLPWRALATSTTDSSRSTTTPPNER